jgi:hypothetical protein
MVSYTINKQEKKVMDKIIRAKPLGDRVSVYLEREMIQIFEKQAKTQKTSFSQIVRNYLYQGIEKTKRTARRVSSSRKTKRTK